MNYIFGVQTKGESLYYVINSDQSELGRAIRPLTLHASVLNDEAI